MFRNLDLKFDYEKVPMFSNGEKVGYLVYCAERPGKKADGGDSGTLAERLEAAERQIIVEELSKADGDMDAAARVLGLAKAVLRRKAVVLGIKIDETPQKTASKKRNSK